MCTVLFFNVDANVYCHSTVGVRAGGPRRHERSESGEAPPKKRPKRILGLSVSLTTKNQVEPHNFVSVGEIFVTTPFEKGITGAKDLSKCYRRHALSFMRFEQRVLYLEYLRQVHLLLSTDNPSNKRALQFAASAASAGSGIANRFLIKELFEYVLV